jgi:hypothetical protein
MSKPQWTIAGDCIIDWVIHNGKVTPTAGGAGNIVRGLLHLGHNVRYLTVYNPMLYPLNAVLPVHGDSLTDFSQRNVFVRNYDGNIFHRYRENVRSKVFDIKDALAVICHEDSVVRRFDAIYADVRDPRVRGTCQFLRMSSSDPWEDIMRGVNWKMAVVTYKDHIRVYNNWGEPTVTIEFPSVVAVDDIGAGDTFDVGFLDWFLTPENEGKSAYDGFRHAVTLAQEKVQQIGVFLHGNC